MFLPPTTFDAYFTVVDILLQRTEFQKWSKVKHRLYYEVWCFHLQESLVFAVIRKYHGKSFHSDAATCIRHGTPASHLLTMMNGSLCPVMNSCKLLFVFCFIKRSIDPLSWQSTLQHLRGTADQDYESTLQHSGQIHEKNNSPLNPSLKVESVLGIKPMSSEVNSQC